MMRRKNSHLDKSRSAFEFRIGVLAHLPMTGSFECLADLAKERRALAMWLIRHRRE
ncbi:hypothetical protein HFN65_31260 [Rhizobium laguerreae]|uniref:hypothetical protein n=1 Tax=Rhizobium laguerreae TaxID=1076926 RepID=UPI001C9225D7|nr:hypothetical protein [Rhizobium laguerreae]MBY3575418.1 hypothetical protein [Rhizobium laguerreae]